MALISTLVVVACALTSLCDSILTVAALGDEAIVLARNSATLVDDERRREFRAAQVIADGTAFDIVNRNAFPCPLRIPVDALPPRVQVTVLGLWGNPICSRGGYAPGASAWLASPSARLFTTGDGGRRIVASVDPAFLEDADAARVLPKGVSVILATRTGEIMARMRVRRSSGEAPRFLRMIASAGDPPSTASVTWPDGTRRITAFKDLGGLIVAAGFDMGMPLEIARKTVGQSLLVLLLAIVGVVAAARFLQQCPGSCRFPGEPSRALCLGDTTVGNGTPENDAARNQASDIGGERAAARARAAFEAIVDQSPDVVFAKDASGRYVAANRAFLALYGLEASDMDGLNEADLFSLVSPQSAAVMARARARAVSGAGNSTFDITLTHRTLGEERTYRATYHPLLDECGRVVGITGIGRDVTEERLASQGIRRARDEVDEASRSKSRFLAAASHDLRQPAQAAMLFAESLSCFVEGNGGEPLLGHLRRSLESLNGLLQTLLGLSQLESGAVIPVVGEVSMSLVLEDLKATHSALAASKGIALVMVPCTAWVLTDRVLLAQMLGNLVENALKYTDKGRVLVDCFQRGNVVRVEVRDSGIGIDRKDLEDIWQEFAQLNNPERDRNRGLGLGLFIVRSLGRMLGHELGVSSEPGRGSTFSVEVPMLAAPRRADQAQLTASHARLAEHPPMLSDIALEPPAGGTPLAVVVDDEAQVREGLRCILEMEGYDVVAAENLSEALDGIAMWGRTPDVIVADYRLREDKVGTDAIRAIRAKVGCKVPALVLTGEIAAAVQDDAGSIGVQVVHKPIEAPRLVAMLESLMVLA